MVKKPTYMAPVRSPSFKPRLRQEQGGIRREAHYSDRDSAARKARALLRSKSPLSADERALQLFPGDIERARRLFAVFGEVRNAFFTAAHKKLVDVAEHRAVLTAILSQFAVPPPQPAAPDEAPELWTKRDLNLRENAPAFIRRVYAQWIGHGLARKDIARLDEDLYKALSVWLYRHPDDEIARELPPQSDVLDDLIKRLSADYPIEVLRKLGYAIDARLRRDAESSQVT